MAKKKKTKLSLNDLIIRTGRSEISSISAIISKIMETIRNPESSARELKDIIDVDPPLCAKILRRANSALYGLEKNISSIQQALIFVGFNTVREIALNMSVNKLFGQGPKIERFSHEKLWKHSLGVALFAKNIFRREFREKGDAIYSAALLHDIGIIIECQFMPEAFKEVVDMTIDTDKPICDCEKSVYTYNHAKIGQEISAKWTFPKDIINAIAFHHKPFLAPEIYRREAATMFLSDYICRKNGLHCGIDTQGQLDENLFSKSLDFLKINVQAIDLITEEVLEELDKMEEDGEL